MQQQTNNSFTTLTNEALKTLCKEIKETNLAPGELKQFSVVDLWHIQKNRKFFGTRRAMSN